MTPAAAPAGGEPADRGRTRATPTQSRRPHRVCLSFADPERRFAAVRLRTDVTVLPDRVDYRRGPDGTWRLELAVPVVDRLEYRLELVGADGTTATTPDPANPARAGGPFGETSVLTLPGYRSPGWLSSPAPQGTVRWVQPRSRRLRDPLPCLLWSPPDIDADAPLPLLVAHDGPELDRFGGLLRCLEVLHDQRRIGPLRAALLAPTDRNEQYSASASYARALVEGVLPALEREVATTMRIGLGASLGGLAMLHAHRRMPGSFAGLLLQSGSFFTAKTDGMEAAFDRFARVSRFVATVLRAAPGYPDAVPVTLTCGLAEENLDNNRLMDRALRAQGYPVRWLARPDAHNWVAWRDAWAEALPSLAAAATGRP